MGNTRKNGRAGKVYSSLREGIKARGLSQVEAARILGKSEPYVSKLVNKKERPSLEMAVRIARLFNVDPAGLL